MRWKVPFSRMGEKIIASLPGYVFALALCIVGLVLNLLFSPLSGIDPFLFFVPIVAVTVWYGGVGPGVFSILCALFASDYFFLPPLYTFGLRIEDLSHTGLFVIVAATVGFITMLNRRYRSTQESLALLSSAIEQADDLVLMTNREGIIEYVNPAFEKVTGYALMQVRGKTPRELKSGEHDSEFYARLWQTILAGTAFRAEMVNRKKSGELYHEEQTITPIKDQHGKITHFISTGKDITERVLARQAVEKERSRMAMELHDSVTQSIYGMKLLADAAQRFTSAGMTRNESETLALLSETAQRALKEMRLLVYELKLPELEQVGLIGALQQRLDSVEKRAGVEASLVTRNVASYSAPIEEMLYRVAQEALNNSLKHAAAKSVTVSLSQVDGQIELQVADDGKGFDPKMRDEQGGMGLITMRQRAERLGGELQIISNSGEGTRVELRIRAEPL